MHREMFLYLGGKSYLSGSEILTNGTYASGFTTYAALHVLMMRCFTERSLRGKIYLAVRYLGGKE